MVTTPPSGVTKAGLPESMDPGSMPPAEFDREAPTMPRHVSVHPEATDKAAGTDDVAAFEMSMSELAQHCLRLADQCSSLDASWAEDQIEEARAATQALIQALSDGGDAAAEGDGGRVPTIRCPLGTSAYPANSVIPRHSDVRNIQEGDTSEDHTGVRVLRKR